jgi:diguanylate cyclase (GGDEF)-like protein/PAS domain S-box-containing protein
MNRFAIPDATVQDGRRLSRLHMIGTLLLVVVLTLVLGAFFVWRSQIEHRESLARLEKSVVDQQKSHLQAELDSAVGYLEFTRKRTDAVLRQSLREQVDAVMQMAQSIYDRESPRRSPAEVKKLIIEALRPMRFFDGRGYFFIDSMQGQFILLPTAPQLEGKTILDNRDDRGHFIMRGLIEAATKPAGEGFSEYRWYSPGNNKVMSDKLAYVRHFAPFDWLIGTGEYVEVWEERQQKEAIARLRGIRFGASGTIGLIGKTGHSIMSPSNSGVEGLHFKDMPSEPRAAVEALYTKALSGGGEVKYLWRASNASSALEKTALVTLFEPWGWVVVASVADDDMGAALQQERVHQAILGESSWRSWIVALALALAIGSLASLWFARWLASLFDRYHADLQEKNQALSQREALFRAVFENAAVGMAQLSLDGRFLQVNQQYCDLLGYSREMLISGQVTLAQILPPKTGGDLQRSQDLQSAKLQNYAVEQPYVRSNQSLVWVSVAEQVVQEDDPNAGYLISVVTDISERKSAEQKILLAASVFTFAREGIMITELDGTIVTVNDAFSRITGFSREEVIGANPRILKSGRHSLDFYTDMWKDVREQGHWVGEIWNRRKDGQLYAELQTVSLVRNERGEPRHYVSLFSDITAQKEHQQEMERMAHFDPLTGLPNRVLLADRLQQAMLTVQRRNQLLAVVYLDLDGFKHINDTLGHDAGDQVLAGAARHMKATLREGDTLARIGGDEFVAVLADLPDVSSCVPLLKRLLSATSQPFNLDGQVVQVSASLGVTFYPQADSIDADQLQRQADQAMYQAKVSGKNRYHVFDAEHDRSVRGHHENIERLQQALIDQEFELHYQPKVNMYTGLVIGVEALIRWQHPQRGLLPPSAFLPDLENHPLSVDVGEWVIRSALQQIRQWKTVGLEMPVSVNMGAMQLQQPEFVQRLAELLGQFADVSPHMLELEVLETSALEDISGISSVIAQCASMGVHFALDDFGTGYSSLTYLKRLPVKTLKIDQSFVRDMLDDADDLAILKGIVGLAAAFRRNVIAEGVETNAHGLALLQLGCYLAQGYGIARPMPGEQIPNWVAIWKPENAWQTVVPGEVEGEVKA